jgi:hypothetical protein
LGKYSSEADKVSTKARKRVGCGWPFSIARRSPFPRGHYSIGLHSHEVLTLYVIARKLLHAIYGIFRSGVMYEGAKVFLNITLS